MKKIAVVLFNLGSPSCQAEIKPYLMNFFTDRNIIDLPNPLRWIVAKMIASKRSKGEAEDNYSEIKYSSPLLKNSLKQADALKKMLGGDCENEYEVFVSMRYWHPMSDEIVGQVKDYNPDEIVLLPLYPQYSTTTTKSSFEDWDLASKNFGLDVKTSKVDYYYAQEGFIQASAKNILEIYEKSMKKHGEEPRILFSAHGLPEKIIKAGDPYQWQCEQSALKIAQEIGIENLDWEVCYQSRVGRLKWIGPSTEEALEQAAIDKVSVVVYPLSFTQEHVETLVDIDIKYREIANDLGVKGFEKVDTVGTNKFFIKGIKSLIYQALGQDKISFDCDISVSKKIY